MEIKQIDYILAVVETGSISKAAEKLHIAQPSLSRYLKTFEDENGFRLFWRGVGQGLTLTPEGELYYRYASQVHMDTERVFREIAKLNNRNEICIAFTMNNASLHYRDFQLALNEFFPNVRLSVTSTQVAFMEEMLLSGATDLVITKDYTHLFENDELTFYPFLNAISQALLIVPADYPVCSQAIEVPGQPYPVLDRNLLRDKPFFRLVHVQKERTTVAAHDGYREKDPMLIEVTTMGDVINFVERGMGYGYIMTSNTEFIKLTDNIRIFIPAGKNMQGINGCTALRSHRFTPAEKKLFEIMEHFPCW